MKLLAFSDLHGEDQFLDNLRRHLAINKYDAVLIAGDIEGYEYAKELLDILSSYPLLKPSSYDKAHVQVDLHP